MKKIIFLLIFIYNIGYADSGIYFETGNDLLPYCQSAIRLSDNPNDYSPLDISQGYKCLGYIEGVADAFEDSLSYTDKAVYNELGQDLNEVPSIQVCRMVVNYMTLNPQYLNLRASALVDSALIENYGLKFKK